jgi:hypothetical protein
MIVKNSYLSILLTLILSMVVVIPAASGDVERLEIVRVGLDKKTFNPSEKETVALGFEITKPATVCVKIYDWLGSEIKRYDMPDLNIGRHNITWDGRLEAGHSGGDEVFLYVIGAKAQNGQLAIYNPALETGGIDVKSLEYTLDTKTGKIEYVLPKACMIRIRAGLKEGMFANTLFDWKPQSAGRHTCQWDGMDKTGQMRLLNNNDLDIRLTCYSLPDNTVIVTSAKTPAESNEVDNKAAAQLRSTIWATKGKYLHYQHDPRICHDPRLKISFPGSVKEINDVPIIAGKVPIRVELDPRDVQHLTDTKFEVVLYIDGVYIYEIEEGSSPFTFDWDTKRFAKGAHIVTINIIGYDDHIGVESRRVIVGDQR